MSQARSKVSVLGAGRVGSAVANALVLLRVCDLVVLYDRDLARAEGQAWDIGDAVPLLSEMVVVPTAEYSDLDGSDVVVVTVGPTLAVGQTAWTWPGSMRASSPVSCANSTGSAQRRS